MGDSGPPTPLWRVVHSHRIRVIDLAYALWIRGAFRYGADLNRPETHAALFAALDIRRAVPRLADTA